MTPKKALIITVVILALVAYAAGSFWVIRLIRQGGTQNTAAATTNTAQTTVVNGTQTTQRPTPTYTPRPTPTPIATPTPLQGPGRYACDGDGICNDYSDEMRQYCPKTFADPHCLGMCGVASVRCSQ